MKKSLPFIFIDEDEAKRKIDLDEAYGLIEKSYVKFSSGQTVTPPTIAMDINQGKFFCFPSYLRKHDVFITKLASFYSSNRRRNLPVIQPYIFLFDSHNGSLLAAISGRYFASVRTAISSVIGVKHLFKHPVKTVAIIGSGVQAASHVRIFYHFFKSLRLIKVYSPSALRLNKFVKEQGRDIQPKIVAAKTSDEAVKDADIIICVTDSNKPVINYHFVSPRALILAVGSMGRDMQEIDDKTVAESVVIVDSEKQINEYGEIVGPKARGINVKIGGEIGNIIIGKKKVNLRNKIIIFKHHGLPVTDAALAESLFNQYKYAHHSKR